MVTKYVAELIGPKVYVHSAQTGACTARLCRTSAEFTTKTDGTSMDRCVISCTFEQFQRECKDRYGVKIGNTLRPNWA